MCRPSLHLFVGALASGKGFADGAGFSKAHDLPENADLAWLGDRQRSYDACMSAVMDEALVGRAQAGDRVAMQDLLTSVAPSIRRFALRMCRNEADADDVLQDALLSIATHLDSFEGRSSVPSWAFALTRSACSRRRRGKKNQPAEGEDALATRAIDATS